MKRLRQVKEVGKKVLSTILMPVALASSIYLSPKKVNAEEVKNPIIELKVENKSFLDDETKEMLSDKMRLTLAYNNLEFRLDKNRGRQSQHMLSFGAVNTDKTKLILLNTGNFGEEIDGKYQKQTHDFGGILFQDLGKLPVLGDTTLKLFNMNSFVKGEKPFQKLRGHLLGENIDLAYDMTVTRDREVLSKYYVAFHNDNLHVSIGKSDGKTIQGALTTKNTPRLGILAWGDYNLETRTFSLTSWNSFKNSDIGTYNQGIGRLVSDLMTLGSIEVAKPILPAYLTTGDITHKIELEIGPDGFKVGNQLGGLVTKNFGLGAGFQAERYNKGKLQIKPLMESYVRIPLAKGLDLYVDIRYEPGNTTALAKISYSSK